MSTYWFRPKQYGYGATPVTWQGWALTLATVTVIVAATLTVMRHSALDVVFWLAVAIDFAAVFVLVEISRRKTDGEWRWRWGDR
jgi:O-antigen/teichoic acid export membrane protein